MPMRPPNNQRLSATNLEEMTVATPSMDALTPVGDQPSQAGSPPLPGCVRQVPVLQLPGVVEHVPGTPSDQELERP